MSKSMAGELSHEMIERQLEYIHRLLIQNKREKTRKQCDENVLHFTTLEKNDNWNAERLVDKKNPA